MNAQNGHLDIGGYSIQQPRYTRTVSHGLDNALVLIPANIVAPARQRHPGIIGSLISLAASAWLWVRSSRRPGRRS
jgi:hypothetical protein